MTKKGKGVCGTVTRPAVQFQSFFPLMNATAFVYNQAYDSEGMESENTN